MTGHREDPSARLRTGDVALIAEDVVIEVERAVIGKREAIVLVLIGVLSGGHVLLEDVPGLAKTLLVRSLARVLGLETSRIQFTPDLMPADVTGSGVFDQARGELVFRPGPVFANLVLGDEINRAPPKTQAALLEAMQEQQVTADGISHRLPSPFAVVATQNPIEYEGTYPLPEAQLDRFLLRLAVGYPDRDAEWEVIRRRSARGREDVELAQICDAGTVLAMREAIEGVEISEPVGRYLVDVVRATRSLAGVEVGSSPRGALALLLASRARAALAGREFVLPDDIKALAVACLADRLMLVPDLWLRGGRPEDLVGQCLDAVPVPVEEPGRMIGPRTGEEAATTKVVAYAALAGIGLLAAVVFGDVAVVGLAAPFAFALAVGLLSPVPPLPRVRLEIDEPRLVEGGRATVTIWLSAPGRVPRCNLGLGVPRGLRAEGPTEWSLGLAPRPRSSSRCSSPPIATDGSPSVR